MTNERTRLVSRAQRAFRLSPDTRALKRELRAGNPYAIALLARRGAEYVNGTIRSRPKEEE